MSLFENFFIWANPGLYFVYFRPFLITISILQIEKSIDGVLGIWTLGRRMVGADKTTELWRPIPFWKLAWTSLDLLKFEIYSSKLKSFFVDCCFFCFCYSRDYPLIFSPTNTNFCLRSYYYLCEISCFAFPANFLFVTPIHFCLRPTGA